MTHYVAEGSGQPADSRLHVHSPADAVRIVRPVIGEDMTRREFCVALYLDQKNGLLGDPYVVAVGSLSGAILHPREILRPAVERSAAAVVVLHNHPSGVPTPSGDDAAMTANLREACKVLGVQLLDHVVIGDGCFNSMAESGVAGFAIREDSRADWRPVVWRGRCYLGAPAFLAVLLRHAAHADETSEILSKNLRPGVSTDSVQDLGPVHLLDAGDLASLAALSDSMAQRSLFGSELREDAARYARAWSRAYQQATEDDRAAGRTWYEDARAWVDQTAAELEVSRSLVAGVTAAISPRVQWYSNKMRARAAIVAGGHAGLFSEHVRRILGGEAPLRVLRGPKVRAFYRALMGDDGAAVIDSHMTRAAGIKPASRGRVRKFEEQAAYRKGAAGLRAAARRHGVKTTHLQAAVWVAERGAVHEDRAPYGVGYDADLGRVFLSFVWLDEGEEDKAPELAGRAWPHDLATGKRMHLEVNGVALHLFAYRLRFDAGPGDGDDEQVAWNNTWAGEVERLQEDACGPVMVSNLPGVPGEWTVVAEPFAE